MKKTAFILVSLVFLSVCLFGCNSENNGDAEQNTLSFSERVSYYDNLADSGEVVTVEMTEVGALYRITGSAALCDGEVYSTIIGSFNKFYPDIYHKYGKEYYEPIITLNFDPTYMRDEPANVVGNTININVVWFNEHPDKANVIIYYIATTIMDYNASAPDWVKAAVNYAIAVEFNAAGYEFDSRYAGGTYENNAQTAASFLNWIKQRSGIDIVYRINKLLITNEWFDDDFWIEETGKTLDRLWAEYKAS